MKLCKTRQCIGLLSSMIYSGKKHSEQSKIMVVEALIELHDAESEEPCGPVTAPVRTLGRAWQPPSGTQVGQ